MSYRIPEGWRRVVLLTLLKNKCISFLLESIVCLVCSLKSKCDTQSWIRVSFVVIECVVLYRVVLSTRKCDLDIGKEIRTELLSLTSSVVKRDSAWADCNLKKYWHVHLSQIQALIVFSRTVVSTWTDPSWVKKELILWSSSVWYDRVTRHRWSNRA